MNQKTANAKGRDLAHKRDEVAVTFRVSKDVHQKMRDVALRNCRTISQECTFRLLRSLESDA